MEREGLPANFNHSKGVHIMLILSRGIDESLMIGDDIEVKITNIKGSYVSIGIKAPKDMIILREELYEDQLEQFEEAI